MSELKLGRREFLKAGGVSAIGASMGLPESASGETARTEGAEQADASGNMPAHEKGFPQLALITSYSPQKLAFAASAGYQGVVIKVDRSFSPRLSDSEIDSILSTSRQTGVRIISIECMAPNHIDPDPARRRAANESFIRDLEFSHRLGCKFTGTFSGGIPGASMEDQAKALADVVNEKYIPVCEKLGMGMGWENYPTATNFATVPAAWSAVFSQVPSKLLGLEFDPSHLVRQFIDPYQAAWDFRDRILAVHAKDTEITEPILQQVGIHGQGWWRYRIPGQGRIDWPRFITALLQVKFSGGMAVEHEDQFWDEPPSNNAAEFPQARKDGFILAQRYLSMFLPGRLS
ncbi:MAG TPA: sugar phosphate isomerase/epimerase [Terriglobia bacterium]|nr:sugar phosphate isomerase/epimerase [Terriglobia bacterium]